MTTRHNGKPSGQDGRLESLDALRGADMLFIMGLATLVKILSSIYPECGWMGEAARQMGHAEWDGFLHHDTIFPLFMFITGVTFPLSFAKHESKGMSRGRMYLKIVYRTSVLVLLGIICNGLFKLQFDTLRYASVLGRIGITWGIAAILYMNMQWKSRAVLSAVILLSYWALSALVGAPDAPGANPLSMEGCLAGYVDRTMLPGRLYNTTFDPEGILSTIPAVVTVLMGQFTGQYLMRRDRSGSTKAATLFVAAVLMAVAATAWNEVYPINKKLWSSSFVLAAGAYPLGVTAIFYFLIDVVGLRRWAFPLKVIGLNSITIFVAQRFIDFHHMGDFFTCGIQAMCTEEWAKAVSTVSFMAAWWIFLYILYRNRTFIRI